MESNNLNENFRVALEDWNVNELLNLINQNDIPSWLIDIKNTHGCTALYVACEMGNFELIRLLVENGANVNEICVYGNTPLHVASSKDNTAIITYLIRKNAYLDATNERNETALQKACQMNLPKNVKVLLDNGANPDIPNSINRTCLFAACYSGYTKIVQYLINAHADVNVEDAYEETPLKIACKFDFTDIAKILLENGANPNVEVGFDGIVQWAIKREEYDLVDTLIKKGAELPLDWIVRENKKHSLRLIIKNGCKIPLVYNRIDLLELAIHNNNIAIASLLMKNVSSNVNEKVEKLGELLSLNRSDRILDESDNDAKKQIRQIKREREREEIVDILCAKKNISMQRGL